MAHRTCSIEDCDGLALRRGWCNMHYLRWRNHGTTDDPRPTLEERFWAKVDRSDPDGCWLWTAAVSPQGHAMFSISKGELFNFKSKRPVGGHRVAYELLVGPVPDGLELDHLCRVRHCVNPAHLEPVTHKENVLRGVSPMALHAAKTHCVHGHPFAGDNLRITNGIRVCRTCHNAQAIRTYWTRKASRTTN